MVSITKAKRSHKTLTVIQKLKLLDQIRTKSYTVLCDEYGIGRSTVTDIKKRESSLREYKQKMAEMGMKRDEPEEGWRTRNGGIFMVWAETITRLILLAKARELHKRLSEAQSDRDDQEFTTSSGWMWRFCKHQLSESYLCRGKNCQQTN